MPVALLGCHVSAVGHSFEATPAMKKHSSHKIFQAAAEDFECWQRIHQISCASMTCLPCDPLSQLLQTAQFLSHRPSPRYWLVDCTPSLIPNFCVGCCHIELLHPLWLLKKHKSLLIADCGSSNHCRFVMRGQRRCDFHIFTSK